MSTNNQSSTIDNRLECAICKQLTKNLDDRFICINCLHYICRSCFIEYQDKKCPYCRQTTIQTDNKGKLTERLLTLYQRHGSALCSCHPFECRGRLNVVRDPINDEIVCDYHSFYCPICGKQFSLFYGKRCKSCKRINCCDDLRWSEENQGNCCLECHPEIEAF